MGDYVLISQFMFAGPYSRELTCDYYAQSTKLESLQTDYELTQSDVQVLEKLRLVLIYMIIWVLWKRSPRLFILEDTKS